MNFNEPVKLLTEPWVPNVELMQAVMDRAANPCTCDDGRVIRPNGYVEACGRCRNHELTWVPRPRR